MAKKANKLGRLNLKEMRNLVNKKAGTEIAYSLAGENPTDVRKWIPTGSRWLLLTVCFWRGSAVVWKKNRLKEWAGSCTHKHTASKLF